MLHRPQLVSGSKRFLQTLPSQFSHPSSSPLPPTSFAGYALNNSTTSSPWISHSLPSLSRAKPFATRMNNQKQAGKQTSASPQPMFLDPAYKPITLEYPPSHQLTRTKTASNPFARALKQDAVESNNALKKESEKSKVAAPSLGESSSPASTAAPAVTSTAQTTTTASSTSSTTADRPVRKFRPRKAAITVTPNALAHVRQLLEGPNPKLLKIGVRNRGCSGLTFHLEYVDKPGAFDEEVIQNGVKVLIDSKALFSIIGSEMDYVDDKLTSRFVFTNPNSKGQCGCGESFMV